MLKPILLSVFSLLSFGSVASSAFFHQNLLAQSQFSGEPEVFRAKSEFNQLIFTSYHQSSEDPAPDTSRGDTRRTSSEFGDNKGI